MEGYDVINGPRCVHGQYERFDRGLTDNFVIRGAFATRNG